MNAEPTNQSRQEKVDLRMRTLRILWSALLIGLVQFYVLTIFVRQAEQPTPNNLLSLILLVLALSTTLISHLVRSKLLNRATELQQVPLVQQGYIVAWAINEAGALLGLFDFFVTGNRFYFLPMLVAACNMLLQFPRRQHVENASFKSF